MESREPGDKVNQKLEQKSYLVVFLKIYMHIIMQWELTKNKAVGIYSEVY